MIECTMESVQRSRETRTQKRRRFVYSIFFIIGFLLFSQSTEHGCDYRLDRLDNGTHVPFTRCYLITTDVTMSYRSWPVGV